jgi:hypothetical protein
MRMRMRGMRMMRRMRGMRMMKGMRMPWSSDGSMSVYR